MNNIIDQFRNAIISVGLTPPQNIAADGTKHRFSTNGKSNDTAGEYCIYPDNIPAGYFKDYRTDYYYPWRYDAGRPYTKIELRSINTAAQKRKQQQELEHIEAAKIAQSIFDSAENIHDDFLYFIKKQAKPIGVKFYDGCATIGLFKDKKTIALQLIDENGDKQFWPPGCTTKGGYFQLAGENNNIFIFVEGYVTGLEVYRATGYTTIVTFTWHNMSLVAADLRAKFPDSLFVYCCDDDFLRKDNPGIKGASEAQKAASGIIIKPKFKEPRPEKATDFNDMAILYGQDEVRSVIMDEINKECEINLRPKVLFTKASDVELEPINWLWPGYLAAGKFHLVAGKPGTGKTTIALDMACTLSLGRAWPDNSECTTGSIVVWSGEDDIKDTLAPRIVSLGGDRNKIEFISATMRDNGEYMPFDPATDIPILRQVLKNRKDIKLLIIDPIVSVVIGDSHKNSEVRKSLQPLVDLAQELNIAILGITHVSKNTDDRDFLDQVTGSLAVTAVARIVFITKKIKLPGGVKPRCAFLHIKSNISKTGEGFYYEIYEKELSNYPGIVSSAIEWGEKVEEDLEDLMRQQPGKPSKLQQAKYFLIALLKDGPMQQTRIEELYLAAGHKPATIKRAKQELKIESEKNDRWSWQLPKEAISNNDAHVEILNPLIPFDDFERLRQKLLTMHPQVIEGVPLQDVLLYAVREDYEGLQDLEAMKCFARTLINDGKLPRKE